MISAMLWSIRSTPAPWSSRTARTTAANSGTSASGRPAAGSSISTKRGSVASARATPRRRSSPCGERGGRRVRVARRARAARAARRLAARARAAAPTPSAATSTFSRTDSERKAWLCWNVRASPCRPRRWALHDVIVAARRARPALVGTVEAGEDVDERRLAGAVWSDQPDDLVTVQLERDALQRAHARERARHAGGPERCSGPPASLLRLPSGHPVRSSGRPSRRPCRRASPCCPGS